MIKYILQSALLVVLCIQFKTTNLSAQDTSVPEGYDLVYVQDFESPQAIRDFEMTDPSAWKISKSNESHTLELFGESEYRARVRSPFNIALLKGVSVGDFVLEVDLSQSGREYGHRDLCLFFNVMSPTNFYYVHIASVADDNANNIFIVNDEPRTNIATSTTSGTDWGKTNSWHKVRIERTVEEGSITIYFDGKKIMEATDLHFIDGRIGFGSFDDTGRFDNIKIWAPKLSVEKEGFFH
jgi:hypothetical protein